MKRLYCCIKFFIIPASALLLASCDSTNSGITFDNFRDRVSALAGDNPSDCGHAPADQGSAQHVCIGSAFVEQSAAFATYENQGVDSRSATGIAVTLSDRVFKVFFDGDPTGGGSSSNGEVTVEECINPSLSGIVDGQPTEVFNCD